MDIKQYLLESEKQYHVRLKTIVPIGDEEMDKIEMMVAKYQPISISRPHKTILQRVPLDFPNIEAAEVYIVDMTFAIPIAPHVLRADIRKVLDTAENFVFVRNRAEPGELQTDILNAMGDIEEEAKTKGLIKVAMLDDIDYNESVQHQDLYGQDYNESLISYLGTVEQERKDTIARVATAPFAWLDLPDRKDQEPVQDNTNYNKDIKGAPFAKPPVKKVDVNYSIFGNFDPENDELRRVYRDKNGKKVVLTRKLKGAQE
jgi:hypothetical protein